MEPASGRRLFITMAVDRYQHPPEYGQLQQPTADAERIGELLSTSGYQQALPGLGSYTTADHVRTSLSGWSKDVRLGGDDAGLPSTAAALR